MNWMKQFLFRKAMHWYVDEDLDQWDRFIVIGKHKSAYVRVDLEKPQLEPYYASYWNELKP